MCKCTYMYVGGCGWAGACVRGCVRYVQVCMVVCGSLQKCANVCECVLDIFSEYLLETRVNTSADFIMYPILIFYIGSTNRIYFGYT